MDNNNNGIPPDITGQQPANASPLSVELFKDMENIDAEVSSGLNAAMVGYDESVKDFEQELEESQLQENNQELEYSDNQNNSNQQQDQQDNQQQDDQQQQQQDNILSSDIAYESSILKPLQNSENKNERIAGDLLFSIKKASDELQNVQIRLDKASVEAVKDPNNEELNSTVVNLLKEKNSLTNSVNKANDTFQKLLNSDEELNSSLVNITKNYNKKQKEDAKFFADKNNGLDVSIKESIDAKKINEEISKITEGNFNITNNNKTDYMNSQEKLKEQEKIFTANLNPHNLNPHHIYTEGNYLKDVTNSGYDLSSVINQKPIVFKSTSDLSTYLNTIYDHKKDFNSYSEITKQGIVSSIFNIKNNTEKYIKQLELNKELISKSQNKNVDKSVIPIIDKKIKEYQDIYNGTNTFLDGMEDDFVKGALKFRQGYRSEFAASAVDLVSSTLAMASRISYITPSPLNPAIYDAIGITDPLDYLAQQTAKGAGAIRDYSSKNFAVVSPHGEDINTVATSLGQVSEQIAESALLVGKVARVARVAEIGLQESELAAKLATGNKISQLVKKFVIDKTEQAITQGMLTLQGIYRGATQNTSDALDVAEKSAYKSIGKEDEYNQANLTYSKKYNEVFKATNDDSYAKKEAEKAKSDVLNPILDSHPIFAEKLKTLYQNTWDAEMKANYVTLLSNLAESFITYRFAKGFVPNKIRLTNPSINLFKNTLNTTVEIAASAGGEYVEEGLGEHSAIYKAGNKGFVKTFGGEKITWLKAFQEAYNDPTTWKEAKIAAWTAFGTSFVEGGASISQNINQNIKNKKQLNEYYKSWNDSYNALKKSNNIEHLLRTSNFQIIYDTAEKEFKMGNKDKAELLTIIANSMNVENMINQYGEEKAYNLIMKPFNDRLEILNKNTEENKDEIEATTVAMNTTDAIFKAKKQTDKMPITFGKDKIFKNEVAKIYNNLKISEAENYITTLESLKLANKDNEKKVLEIQKEIDNTIKDIDNIKLQSSKAQEDIDFINSRKGQLQYIEKDKIYKDIISEAENSNKFLSPDELIKSIDDGLRNNNKAIKGLKQELQDKLKNSIGSYVLSYGNNLINLKANKNIEKHNKNVKQFNTFKNKITNNGNFVITKNNKKYTLTLDDGQSHDISKNNYTKLQKLEKKFKLESIDAIEYGKQKQKIINSILEDKIKKLNNDANILRNSRAREQDELRYTASRFTQDGNYYPIPEGLKSVLDNIERVANENGVSYFKAKEKLFNNIIKKNKKETKNEIAKKAVKEIKKTTSNQESVNPNQKTVNNVEKQSSKTINKPTTEQSLENEILKSNGIVLENLNNTIDEVEQEVIKDNEQNLANIANLGANPEEYNSFFSLGEDSDIGEEFDALPDFSQNTKKDNVQKTNDILLNSKMFAHFKKFTDFVYSKNNNDFNIKNITEKYLKSNNKKSLNNLEKLILQLAYNHTKNDNQSKAKAKDDYSIMNSILSSIAKNNNKSISEIVNTINNIIKKEKTSNNIDRAEIGISTEDYDKTQVNTFVSTILKLFKGRNTSSHMKFTQSVNGIKNIFADNKILSFIKKKVNGTTVSFFNNRVIYNSPELVNYIKNLISVNDDSIVSSGDIVTISLSNNKLVVKKGDTILGYIPSIDSKSTRYGNDRSENKKNISKISEFRNELFKKIEDSENGEVKVKINIDKSNSTVIIDNNGINLKDISDLRLYTYDSINDKHIQIYGKNDNIIIDNRNEIKSVLIASGMNTYEVRYKYTDSKGNKHYVAFIPASKSFKNNKDSKRTLKSILKSFLGEKNGIENQDENTIFETLTSLVNVTSSVESIKNTKDKFSLISNNKKTEYSISGMSENISTALQDGLAFIFRKHGINMDRSSFGENNKISFKFIKGIIDEANLPLNKKVELTNSIVNFLSDNMADKLSNTTTKESFNSNIITVNEDGSISEKSKSDFILSNTSSFVSQFKSQSGNAVTFLSGEISLDNKYADKDAIKKVDKNKIPSIEEKNNKTDVDMFYEDLELTKENENNYDLLSNKKIHSVLKSINPFVILTEKQHKAIARHIINFAIGQTKTNMFAEFEIEINNSIDSFIKGVINNFKNDLAKLNDKDNKKYAIIEKVLSDLSDKENLANYIKKILREEYGLNTESKSIESNIKSNFDKQTYEEDPLSRSQPSVKVFLSKILNVNSKESIFGLPEGQSIKQVYNLLLNILSDTDTNIEAVKNRLNIFRDIFDWVNPLINSLDTYSDKSVVNDFISTLTLASIDFKTVYIDKKESNDGSLNEETNYVYRASVINSSSSSAYSKLINLFNSNIKSSLYKINKDGSLSPDNSKVKKVITNINQLLDKILNDTRFDTEGLTTELLQDVKQIFDSIGITLSDATLSYINTYGINVKGEMVTFTNNKKNGILNSLVYLLNSINNNKTSNIQSQEILKKITDLESKLSLDFFSTKTIIGDKNIYPYGTKTNLDDIFSILKIPLGNSLVSLLENDPYTKNSFLLNILTGKIKGFNEEDINLSHIELNPIKIKNVSEEITDIQHLDPVLRFITKMVNNGISKNIKKTGLNSNGERIFFEQKRMLLPTMSDKKRSISINMPVINTEKTGKQASIRFLLEQTVLPELRRMQNYKSLLDSNIKGVNENTIFNMYNFPVLNKYINDIKDAIKNDNAKAEDIFKSLSESMIDDLLIEFDNLVNKKLKYINDNFKNENTLPALLENTKFKEYKGNTKEKLKNFLFNFELNTIFSNSQISRTAFMDMMYYNKNNNYNTIKNLTKRMIILSAPGIKPAFESVKSVKFIPLEDIENIKLDEKYASSLRKFIGDKADEYIKSPGTDGQQYHTWQTHLKILQATGKIGNEKITQKEINRLYYLFSNNIPFTEMNAEDADLLQLVLQVFKPIYTGIRNSDNNAIPFIIKNSSFPLIPQLTSMFPKIDNLRNRMEELEQDDNIVLASYDSAIKVGNPNRKAIVSENLTKDEVESLALDIPINGFRLQQNVPYHTELAKEDKIIMGTQLFKILLSSGVLNHLEVKIDNKTYKGNDIVNLYNDLTGKLFSSREDLYNKILGINNINDIAYDEKSLKKVVNDIKQGLVASGLDDMFDIVATDSGFELVYNQTAFAQPIKMQEAIGALNKKLFLDVKMPGYSFVAGSNNGFEQLATLKTKYNSKIIWTENIYERANNDGEISFKDNEILLPHKFRNIDGTVVDLFKKKNGEYLYIQEHTNDVGNTYFTLRDNVEKSLLEVVGYRIPTSAHALGKGYKIIGFTPTEFGDVMLLPRNITVQKGLDFDVDKENIYLKRHRVSDNGIISIENAAINYIKNTLIANRILPKDIQNEIQGKSLNEKLDVLYNYFENLLKNDKIEKVKIAEEQGKELTQNDIAILKQAKGIKLIANILFKYKNNVIENNIIDIYKAVYFSQNNDIQRLINYPTTTEHAVKQVPLFSDTNNDDAIPLSDDVQDNMLEQNNFGKDAIGVYAKISSLKYAIESLTEQQRNIIDNTLKEFIYNINIIDDRGNNNKKVSINNLNGLFSEDNRPIFDALNERMNLATDNGKLQALSGLGISRNNMAFDAIMTSLGFDEVIIDGKRMDFSFILLNNQTIKKYIDDSSISKNPFSKKEFRPTIVLELLNNFSLLGYDESYFRKNTGQINDKKVLLLAESYLQKGINAKVLYNDNGSTDDKQTAEERIKALALLNKIKKVRNILSFVSNLIGVHSSQSWSPYEYANIKSTITEAFKNAEKKEDLINKAKVGLFEELIMQEISLDQAKNEDKSKVIYALDSVWKIKSAFGYFVAKSLEFSDNLFNVFNMESFDSIGDYNIKSKEEYLKILMYINNISKNSNDLDIANTFFDNNYTSSEILRKNLTVQLPLFIQRIKYLISNKEDFKKYKDNKLLQLLKVDNNNDIALLASSYTQEEILNDMIVLLKDNTIISENSELILNNNGKYGENDYTISDLIKDLITYSSLSYNNNFRSINNIVNARILNALSDGKYSKILKSSTKTSKDIANNSSYIAYLALKGINIVVNKKIKQSIVKKLKLYGTTRDILRFDTFDPVVKYNNKLYLNLGSNNYIEVSNQDMLKLSTNSFEFSGLNMIVDSLLRTDLSSELFNYNYLQFNKDKKVQDSVKIARILDTIDQNTEGNIIKVLEYPTANNNLIGKKGITGMNSNKEPVIKLNINKFNKNVNETLDTYSHELTHGLLRKIFNSDNIEKIDSEEGLLPRYKIKENSNLSPEIEIALNHFIDLYEQAKTAFNITTKEETNNKLNYPLSNISEFAAGLFENKEFKEELKKHKYNGESLLTKLAKTIANIIRSLGNYIGINKKDLYSESVYTALRLMIDDSNKELLEALDKYHGEDDEVITKEDNTTTTVNEERPLLHVKKQFKGKLILAQPGMGKTTASQSSNDVVDVDTLIMEYFGIDPKEENAKTKMFNKIAESQGTNEYNIALRTSFYTSGEIWDKIQSALKEGKTVVIPSWDVVKESIEGDYVNKLIPDFVITYDNNNDVIKEAASKIDFTPVNKTSEEWMKGNISNFNNTTNIINTVNKDTKSIAGNTKEGKLLNLSDILFEGNTSQQENKNIEPMINKEINLKELYKPYEDDSLPKC